MTSLIEAQNRIYVIWLGPPMNAARVAGLRSIEIESGMPVELVVESSVGDWEVASSPIHPAFEYLTEIQKSDYLRAYLMHHHGGGYSDIKPCVGSWIPALKALNSSVDHFGVGYQEIGRHGVAHLGLNLTKRLELQPLNLAWWRYRWLQVNYKKLLGNCSFIFRPQSPFTSNWIAQVHMKLDHFHDSLRQNPAQHPKERPGTRYEFGISSYPISWGDLMANIFHPLCLTYRKHLLQNLPTPLFSNYE